MARLGPAWGASCNVETPPTPLPLFPRASYGLLEGQDGELGLGPGTNGRRRTPQVGEQRGGRGAEVGCEARGFEAGSCASWLTAVLTAS